MTTRNARRLSFTNRAKIRRACKAAAYNPGNDIDRFYRSAEFIGVESACETIAVLGRMDANAGGDWAAKIVRENQP